MKTLSLLVGTCLAGAALNLAAADPAKESERDQQQLTALAKEIQGQQTAIADNQKKIDEKMTSVGEALRLARIYASRAGK